MKGTNESMLLKKFFGLPIDAQREILNFMDFLATRRVRKKTKKYKRQVFSFDWEGGLSEITNTTSVDLQHRANQWR